MNYFYSNQTTPYKPSYKQSRRMNKTVFVDEPKSSDRLILVLDESGSMAPQKNDIIGGINETIRQQRELEPSRNGQVHFDIVKFSSIVKPARRETLESIREFGDADYRPTGSTALYDAIGKTISEYRNERDVIMIIATDGEENASRTYAKPEIVRMIAEQREKFDWDFVYLSEDIDTFKQGTSMGMVNGSKGAYNACVGDKYLGKTMESSGYQAQICNLRQKKAANFSSFSRF